MKPKTLKTVYWAVTIFLALLLLMDGVSGMMRVQDGQDAMHLLGYPEYIMSILGMAKLLAALAILQNKFRTLKEWAFAGLVFTCLGASASWAFVGNLGFVFPPLIMAAMVLSAYFLWKKVRQLPAADTAPAYQASVAV